MHTNLDLVTLKDLESIKSNLHKSGFVYHTPLISDMQNILGLQGNLLRTLSLKLENMQNQGSFKMRGTIYQFLHLKESTSNKPHLVTMSAGNYGKAFCYSARQFGLPATVFMPENAPSSRKDLMEAMGANVIRCLTEDLTDRVAKHQKECGSIYLHPFDDPVLIAGHASAGLEAIEDLQEVPDVALVCCGGGGFLAGVTLAFQRKGLNQTKIYGVEPENAPSMNLSFQHGAPTTIIPSPTVAAGLAPPYAGENAYNLIKNRVEDILLVSEQELKTAVAKLFNAGLVVEPSGAAAVAALISGKVPETEGKHVLAFITGGNTSPTELCRLMDSP